MKREDKDRIIDNVAEVLSDPELASLTKFELAKIIVEDVLMDEIEIINERWTGLSLLPRPRLRHKGN